MAKSQSARRFTFSEIGFSIYFYILLMALIAISACGEDDNQASSKAPDWNYFDSNSQYRTVQIETNLAKAGNLYLVMDFRRNKIMLKLKGAVVWDYPMAFTGTDSLEIRKFIKAFVGDSDNPYRLVKSKYLFEAAEKTPDSVLQIVGEVVKVDPQLLQRKIPKQFQIGWNSKLKLVVKTDISGEPLSRFQNALIRITDALDSPLGEKIIELKMEPTAALTLYDACNKGLPTLLVTGRGK